jgi:hypothetical protein
MADRKLASIDWNYYSLGSSKPASSARKSLSQSPLPAPLQAPKRFDSADWADSSDSSGQKIPQVPVERMVGSDSWETIKHTREKYEDTRV